MHATFLSAFLSPIGSSFFFGANGFGWIIEQGFSIVPLHHKRAATGCAGKGRRSLLSSLPFICIHAMVRWIPILVLFANGDQSMLWLHVGNLKPQCLLVSYPRGWSWIPCGVYCQSRVVEWLHTHNPEVLEDCAGIAINFSCHQRLDDNMDLPLHGHFKALPCIPPKSCSPPSSNQPAFISLRNMHSSGERNANCKDNGRELNKPIQQLHDLLVVEIGVALTRFTPKKITLVFKKMILPSLINSLACTASNIYWGLDVRVLIRRAFSKRKALDTHWKK